MSFFGKNAMLCGAVVGLFLHALFLACSGNVKHEVGGDVESNHSIKIDLEMCREKSGEYRADCVDKFLEAWKSENDCEDK